MDLEQELGLGFESDLAEENLAEESKNTHESARTQPITSLGETASTMKKPRTLHFGFPQRLSSSSVLPNDHSIFISRHEVAIAADNRETTDTEISKADAEMDDRLESSRSPNNEKYSDSKKKVVTSQYDDAVAMILRRSAALTNTMATNGGEGPSRIVKGGQIALVEKGKTVTSGDRDHHQELTDLGSKSELRLDSNFNPKEANALTETSTEVLHAYGNVTGEEVIEEEEGDKEEEEQEGESEDERKGDDEDVAYHGEGHRDGINIRLTTQVRRADHEEPESVPGTSRIVEGYVSQREINRSAGYAFNTTASVENDSRLKSRGMNAGSTHDAEHQNQFSRSNHRASLMRYHDYHAVLKSHHVAWKLIQDATRHASVQTALAAKTAETLLLRIDLELGNARRQDCSAATSRHTACTSTGTKKGSKNKAADVLSDAAQHQGFGVYTPSDVQRNKAEAESLIQQAMKSLQYCLDILRSPLPDSPRESTFSQGNEDDDATERSTNHRTLLKAAVVAESKSNAGTLKLSEATRRSSNELKGHKYDAYLSTRFETLSPPAVYIPNALAVANTSSTENVTARAEDHIMTDGEEDHQDYGQIDDSLQLTMASQPDVGIKIPTPSQFESFTFNDGNKKADWLSPSSASGYTQVQKWDDASQLTKKHIPSVKTVHGMAKKVAVGFPLLLTPPLKQPTVRHDCMTTEEATVKSTGGVGSPKEERTKASSGHVSAECAGPYPSRGSDVHIEEDQGAECGRSNGPSPHKVGNALVMHEGSVGGQSTVGRDGHVESKLVVFQEESAVVGKGGDVHNAALSSTPAARTNPPKPSCKRSRAVETPNSVPPDGWDWRKYGQKARHGHPFPRSYYRCTQSGNNCPAKKTAERCIDDPDSWIVEYLFEHNHERPTPRRITKTAMNPKRASLLQANNQNFQISHSVVDGVGVHPLTSSESLPAGLMLKIQSARGGSPGQDKVSAPHPGLGMGQDDAEFALTELGISSSSSLKQLPSEMVRGEMKSRPNNKAVGRSSHSQLSHSQLGGNQGSGPIKEVVSDGGPGARSLCSEENGEEDGHLRRTLLSLASAPSEDNVVCQKNPGSPLLAKEKCAGRNSGDGGAKFFEFLLPSSNVA